jgi:iron(III) transport system substrate-binding protein
MLPHAHLAAMRRLVERSDMSSWKRRLAALAAAALVPLMLACGSDDPSTVTVYSGRNESLIGPILAQFTQETGIPVEVRYDGTPAMAATLLEEGSRSPADVFIAQDAGALGALEAAGLLEALSNEVLSKVPEAYRSPSGRWVALSGRVRVLVYNTDRLTPGQLPDSILDLTDEEWRGRIAWAPTNASLQAFVTALRVMHGEDRARAWLEGMKANGVVDYPNNSSIVEAVARGEVDLGLVNHYYLFSFLRDQGESFKARNYYTAPGDIGTLVNIAGAAILASSDAKPEARRLVEFLLSEQAQRYFAEQTFEYPVVEGVPSSADLPSLASLEPPAIDLGDLKDLNGTLNLMRATGALP